MSHVNEIILYQPDDTLALDVRVEDDTVWLTQTQIVELFTSSKANISEHLKHIFESGELEREATVRKFRTVRKEGNRNVCRTLEFFNLDVIISVVYILSLFIRKALCLRRNASLSFYGSGRVISFG